MKSETKKLFEGEVRRGLPLQDGTVYSRRKGIEPFCASPIKDYVPIVGEEKVEELQKLAATLKGVKILEFSSTAVGGGVAEMLYSQVSFLNQLELEDEWKVCRARSPFTK